MRGEYLLKKHGKTRFLELPPRARRIHASVASIARDRGTTSACAENTADGSDAKIEEGNYLRVRGEYGLGVCYNESIRELPPRARRIRGGILI